MKHVFRIRLSRLWLGAACLLTLAGSAPAQIQLSDLAANPAPGVSNPTLRGTRVFNGRLYFSAQASVALGQELAVTDGTPAGTFLVRNINTGLNQGSDPQGFTEFNGKLYFSAMNSSEGRELWATDGTQAGTQLVKNIGPGGVGSDPSQLAVANGKLYFLAERTAHRPELWVSDGTETGTQRLTDALGIPTGGFVREIVASGNTIFYSTQTNDLWVTDGTVAGTRFLKGGPLNAANPMGPRTFISLYQLTDYDGRLIFRGNSPIYEDEPWFSDGTPEGTRVIDVIPGALGSFPDPPFVYFNGLMFFTANNPGTRLMATDGTLAGTRTIKTGFAQNIIAFGGRLYFTLNQRELWSTDGTEAGTQRVIDLNANANSFVVSNNKLFFITSPLWGGGDNTLWQSDGTQAGTFQRVGSIVRSVFAPLVNLNDQLIYRGQATSGGSYLYRSTTNATPPGPPIGPFTLSAPLYNCTTGAFTLQTNGGNGTTIEYQIPGITDWTTNPAGIIPTHIRQDANSMPLLLRARQSGIEVGMTFNFMTACGGSGSGALQLTAPTYDCTTGNIRFNTSGGNGSTITFTAPGIWRASATSNTGIVEIGLRFDPKLIVITAMQSGVVADYTFNPVCVSSRLAADPGNSLSVRVLGNPATGERVEVEISGAEGKALRVQLLDNQGRLFTDDAIDKAAKTERRTIRMAREPGIYLLRVSTDAQSQTVKIVR